MRASGRDPWVYNGAFLLVHAWQDDSDGRQVCKFKLQTADTDADEAIHERAGEIDHTRAIPTDVKHKVWARDRGRCTECGSEDNLHFDHIIPYSRGGSSLTADYILLLSAGHNLEKRYYIV